MCYSDIGSSYGRHAHEVTVWSKDQVWDRVRVGLGLNLGYLNDEGGNRPLLSCLRGMLEVVIEYWYVIALNCIFLSLFAAIMKYTTSMWQNVIQCRD